ncbi:MAG: entericidin [Muribaculaceae bacterium]
MKKLVLMLAVAFSVSLFSCGGNAEKECCESCKQDSVETPAPAPADSVTTDSVTTDSVAPEA